MARTQSTSKGTPSGSQARHGIPLPANGPNDDDAAISMSGAKKDFDKSAQGKNSPAKNKDQDQDKWSHGTQFEVSVEDEDDDWF